MANRKLKTESDRRWGYPFCVDGYVSMLEAAHKLGVSKATVYRLCKRGKLRRGKKPGQTTSVICKRSLEPLLTPVEV